MKKLSNKTLVYSLLFLLMVGVVFAAGVNKKFASNLGAVTSVVSGTYADSQADTLKIDAVPNLSSLALGISFSDSVSLTNVIVRRVVNGVMVAVVAGDTLLGATASTANGGVTYLKSITLAPLGEQYWVFPVYAASANGVTSPTVRYSIHRTFTYR